MTARAIPDALGVGRRFGYPSITGNLGRWRNQSRLGHDLSGPAAWRDHGGAKVDWGDELAAAWNSHNVEALIAMFAPTIRYTDLPSGLVWEGHDGLRKLFAQTVEFHPDYLFTKESGFSDGRNYAWEWTTTGTTLGTMLSYRGVSVGTFDDQGLIIENRDYWNPKDIPGLG